MGRSIPTPVLVGLDIGFAEVLSAGLALLETCDAHRNRCLMKNVMANHCILPRK